MNKYTKAQKDKQLNCCWYCINDTWISLTGDNKIYIHKNVNSDENIFYKSGWIKSELSQEEIENLKIEML